MNFTEIDSNRYRSALPLFKSRTESLKYRGVSFSLAGHDRLIISAPEWYYEREQTEAAVVKDCEWAKSLFDEVIELSPEFGLAVHLQRHHYCVLHDYGKGTVLIGRSVDEVIDGNIKKKSEQLTQSVIRRQTVRADGRQKLWVA